jgi:NMD protein affecting ribosome stability and mRNA decay
MKPRALPPGFRRVRRDRQIHELVHDSYKARSKPVEPTVCPDCGALFHGGRWQRLPAPAQAHRELCPACHRIRDRFPAGYVVLDGEFLAGHRDEVLHLLRHVESRESAEHPLQRIMDISREDGSTVVTTTDPHLARALGEAVHRAYRGKLEFHYNPEQNLLRVHWAR